MGCSASSTARVVAGPLQRNSSSSTRNLHVETEPSTANLKPDTSSVRDLHEHTEQQSECYTEKSPGLKGSLHLNGEQNTNVEKVFIKAVSNIEHKPTNAVREEDTTNPTHKRLTDELLQTACISTDAEGRSVKKGIRTNMQNTTEQGNIDGEKSEHELKVKIKEVKDKFKDVIPHLLTLTDFDGDAVHAQLSNISKQTQYKLGTAFRESVANALVEADIVDVFAKMWRYAFSKLGTPEGSAKTTVFRNFRQILVIIWNGSDASPPMCQELIKQGFINTFFEAFNDPRFAPSFLETDMVLEYIVKGLLGILHNIIQHCFSAARDAFREAGAVNILQRYRNMAGTKLGNPMLKCKAVLLLAYIINEDEQSVINSDDTNIQFLVKVLKSAMEGENHKSKRYGFSAVEVVSGLNKLAANDENKKRIVDCGALPLYIQLLAEDCTITEQGESATGLWTLAFNPKNKDRIIDETNAVAALQALTSSNNDRVKKAAKGALWVLQKEDVTLQKQKAQIATADSQVPEQSHVGQRKGHVMISYQWGSKPIMIEIKDRLKAAGFSVWMDIENMSGSTLEAMAEAVEKASVVVMGMTRKYKESNSCRTEAEYTYKLQKSFIPLKLEKTYVADGWLGIMIGTKLYFDFSKDGRFESTMANLIRELRIKQGAVSNEADVTDHAITPGGSNETVIYKKQVASLTDSVPRNVHSASSWTSTEVQSWLKKNKIEALNRFDDFTGELLLELQDMHRTAPEFYFKTLRTDMNFPLITILKITKALKEL